MQISETKKSNKYVALVTYLIAVVCLLLGLFLPLFAGSDILALKLPYVIKNIYKPDLTFDYTTPSLIHLIDFGTGKFYINIMAVAVLLYTAVTALSVLALIPVGLSIAKKGKAAVVFEYIVEVAAVAVLSLYVILALEYAGTVESAQLVSYNILIALGGCLLMLVLLSLINKKGLGFLKVVLFILGAIAVLVLYNLTLIIPALSQPLSGLPLSPALFGANGEPNSAINYLMLLFTSGYGYSFVDVLNSMPGATSKALMVLCALTALIVIINYFINVICLATNGKRKSVMFNMCRYALEVASIICLFVTIAVAKYTIGLMLVILAVVAVISLVIELLRFIVARKSEKANAAIDLPEIKFAKPYKHNKVNSEPAPAPIAPAQPAAGVNNQHDEQPAQMGITKLHPVEINPVDVQHKPAAEPENINLTDDGHVQMKITEQPEEVIEVVIEQAPPAPAPIAPKPLVSASEPVQPVQPVQPLRPVQPVQPVQPLQPAQPAQPVQPLQPAQTAAPQNTEPHIYTFNTIYGGPVDEFIKKLTNDERIEFAMTFIEKSKGNTGNIPDYVVGGNNKNFFSAVFIYLGRIRGMISDGLLNKMYKELNMF